MNNIAYAALAIVAAVLLALNQRWCAGKTRRERLELALKYHIQHQDDDREYRD